MKPGTKIFVAANTVECSTFEGHGSTGTNCGLVRARWTCKVLHGLPSTAKRVPLTAVETALLHIVLPADNIFGLAAGTGGLSVAHGWVALLHPLTPGRHTIRIDLGTHIVVTKIIVKPGH